MDGIVQIISTVGFPIAMCLLLAWYVKTKDEAHAKEIDKLSEAVNQQTLNIQKLVDRFDTMLTSLKTRKAGITNDKSSGV